MMLGGPVLFAAGALAGALAMEILRSRRLTRRLHDVALCSHELRGALTAIGLALSRVEGHSQAHERMRLAALRHGYDRALSVARDLESARGARPATAVQRPELVDLQDIARRVVEAWNGSVPGGRRTVSLDWRAGAASVQGYAVRLTQALDNLVANAVEHGRGPVTVTGRISGGFVAICVLDRGPGLPRSLEDFRRRSWQSLRGHGLVIARHAVELHGGTLRPVRGPAGAGVEVRLPAGPDTAPTRVPGVPAPPRRSGSGAAAP
jgi:signal transduction histidine kinase